MISESCWSSLPRVCFLFLLCVDGGSGSAAPLTGRTLTAISSALVRADVCSAEDACFRLRFLDLRSVFSMLMPR